MLDLHCSFIEVGRLRKTHMLVVLFISHRGYCTGAFHHSKELAGLTPSGCAFNPISLLASRTAKSISLECYFGPKTKTE